MNKPLSPNHYHLSAIKGQSLIEVLVAIAIVALVALGLVRVTTSSIRNTGYSKEQNQASILAQKIITEVIAQKNTNPSSFFASLRLAPLISVDSTIIPFCIKTVTKISALPTDMPDYASAEMAKITVDIYWGETGAGGDCGEKNYSSHQYFETYVTN